MGEQAQGKLPQCRGSTVSGCGHRFVFRQAKSKANLPKEETQTQVPGIIDPRKPQELK